MRLEEIRAELEQALPRNDPTDAANWAAEHGRRLLEIAEAAWRLPVKCFDSDCIEGNLCPEDSLRALIRGPALSPNPDKEK